jgi:hypothetical protein
LAESLAASTLRFSGSCGDALTAPRYCAGRCCLSATVAWVGDEFVDFPEWVAQRLARDGLTTRELEYADWLRERFEELGVDLDALGSKDNPTGVGAFWKAGGWVVGEDFRSEDEKPLYEALHRLVGAVAGAKGCFSAGQRGG